MVVVNLIRLRFADYLILRRFGLFFINIFLVAFSHSLLICALSIRNSVMRRAYEIEEQHFPSTSWNSF